MRLSRLFAAFGLGTLLIIEPAIAAPFLSVDIQQSASNPVETGFQALAEADFAGKTYTTTEGDVTASISNYSNTGRTADFPPDSGAFTYGQLLEDYVFLINSTGRIHLTLSGPGIHANQDYQVTLYAYWANANTEGTATGDSTFFSFDPSSDTTGSTGSVFIPDAPGQPTSNDQYAYTGVWRSDTASLEIDAYTLKAGNPRFAFINGFEISQAPEPSVSLFAAGAVTLLLHRGRRAH